jgi:hypothetical protein
MLRVLSVVAIDSRVYPHRILRKLARVLMAAGVALGLVLAGCGGGGGGQKEQAGALLSGPGFSFRAPGDWLTSVTPRTALARPDEVTLVSVTVLPLIRPYKPKLFPRVAVELDRVAGTLATRLRGSVTARRTTLVAGRRVRQYEITHDELVDRLTFVLRAKREFLLTCRWRKQDGEPEACAQLTSTFRLR